MALHAPTQLLKAIGLGDGGAMTALIITIYLLVSIGAAFFMGAFIKAGNSDKDEDNT